MCVSGEHERAVGASAPPSQRRADAKNPPKKPCCKCFSGLTPDFDSNAELVIQRKKPQLLGEITSQADPWQERLTLAQLKNMHELPESLYGSAGKKTWLASERSSRRRSQHVTGEIEQIHSPFLGKATLLRLSAALAAVHRSPVGHT